MRSDKRRFRQLEHLARGFSNRNRIAILELLKSNPELSVRGVSKQLGIGYKSAAQHLERLAVSNLLMKRYDGNHVRHALSRRGEAVLAFLRRIEGVR